MTCVGGASPVSIALIELGGWTQPTTIDSLLSRARAKAASPGAGIAQISFTFSDQKSGELVPIEITVTYQSISGTTKTSFRIWN